ncbi:MAG: hypothetical protein WC242_00565 [Candidatus Paceibacterota bacterium]|jgi:hypothetical protein
MEQQENRSVERQIEDFERKRQLEEEQALNQLLIELEEKQRELSPVEIVFLRRQLDKINEALRKPHEDGIERDDLTTRSEKINKILEIK